MKDFPNRGMPTNKYRTKNFKIITIMKNTGNNQFVNV